MKRKTTVIYADPIIIPVSLSLTLHNQRLQIIMSLRASNEVSQFVLRYVNIANERQYD